MRIHQAKDQAPFKTICSCCCTLEAIGPGAEERGERFENKNESLLVEREELHEKMRDLKVLPWMHRQPGNHVLA